MRRSKWTFLTLGITSIIAASTVAASCLPDGDKKQAKIDELTIKIKEKDKLIQKANELKAKFDALKREKDSINKQLQSAQKTVKELQKKNKDENPNNDIQIAQLQETINSLKSELKTKEAENATLNNKIKKLEAEIKELKDSDPDYEFIDDSETNDDNGSDNGSDTDGNEIVDNDKNNEPKKTDAIIDTSKFIIDSPYKTAYVRPPFGAQFKLNNHDINFTTIFGHLDSPGSRSKKAYTEGAISDKDEIFINKYQGVEKMGSQEFSEFLALPNVMNDFENISANSNIIFGGDTNITAQNFALQDNFTSNYFATITGLENSQDPLGYYTSIGVRNPYSQPYDKMFFKNVNKEQLKFLTTANTPEKQFKIDILNAFKDDILNEKDKKITGYDSKKAGFGPIRYGVSDHAPVFTDIETKFELKTNKAIEKYAKGVNTLRIGHWNICNYGSDKMPPFKYTSIAKIIAAGGFDILGLTEVNYEQVEKVNEILNILNQITGSQYKMVYQDSSDASWANDPVLNIFESQQEQVAIIYDANIVTPVAFNNGKIGHSYRKIIPSYKEIAQLKSLTEQE
ncbi:hypothetical protein ACNQ17_00170 [Mycoplasma sp. Sp48II]|uniref:hypothetical protein n=1 Tax=Mycoplasma sp. Sp48II TaxID=3401682 RepID=UPI003AB0B297